MRNTGDRFSLQNGCRREQRSGRDKEDVSLFFQPHTIEDMPAQHRRAAAASGASRVDVYILGTVDHHAAVLVDRLNVDPLEDQKLIQKLAADLPQIPGIDRVKLRRLRLIR